MNKVSFKEKFFLRQNNSPSIFDIIVVLGITILLMFTVSAFLAYKFGFWGNVSIQFIVIVVPILYIKIMKLDIKQIFPIKKPSLRHIFGAGFFWFGTLILTGFTAALFQLIFPDSAEGVQMLSELLMSQSLIVLIFTVALLPAICEEFLFRGFVYSGLKNKFSPYIALLITSILFGIFHLDLLRFISTTILGIAINYALYKTDNIFISTYIHFLNNLFSIVLLKLSNLVNTEEISDMQQLNTFPDVPVFAIVIAVIFYLAIAISFLILGLKLLGKSKKEKYAELKSTAGDN